MNEPSAIRSPKSVFRGRSLRTKIIAWFFVPTAIILIAVALVNYYAYQQVTRQLVIERDEKLIRLSAGQLATELAEYTDLLAAIARNADISHYNPPAQRVALKSFSNRLVVFDGSVLILDPFGTVVAVEPERPDILEQDLSDRNYFRQMVRSPGPVFSDVVTDGPQGAEVIVVAVPITGDQGEFLGTMAGMFRLGATTVSAFYGSVVKLRLGERGSTYLVDGNGRVIYHSEADYIGQDFSTQAVVQQVLTGQVGAIRTQDFGGRDIVAGFAPVPGTSWGLVTEEGWATLTSGSRGYQQFLLLLLVLGIAVPALVVAVGVRRIMQPIEDLIGAAREVARGNFGQTIKARTGDEIEALARQFNRMSAQLKESYANLEQRVADRTKELAILNAIGASVNASLDLYNTLDRILDETLGLLDLEVGEIRLLDESSGELVIRTERGLSLEYVRLANRQKVSEKLPEQSILTGEPVIEPDIFASSQHELARQEGLRAVATFPLRAKEKLLGTLCLATRRGPRSFARNEQELLRAVGDQAAVAIENARLYAEAGRRVDESETLFAVGQAISSRLDPDAVLQMIADEARRLTSARLALVFLLEGDVLRLSVISGEDTHNVSLGYRMPVAQSLTRAALQSGQPIRVADADREPRAHAHLVERLKIRSLMIVPLMSGSEPIGSISVANKISGVFGPDDERVLSMLASGAVIGLENARLYEAERRRAEQFRVIGEVGRSITSILTVDELLGEMVRLIKEAFNYHQVIIGLIEGDEVVAKAGAGPLSNAFQSLRLKVGQEGIGGWVAQYGEPLLVPDVSQEPQYYSLGEVDKTRSALAVPLKTKEAVVGVLNVHSDHLNAFDESDLAVLQSLAHQAAIAIENARLYEQARQLAVVEERNRLARELHDSATQSLYGVTMFAEAAARLLRTGETERAAEHLREVRETAQEALQEMRLLIFELRPPILEKEGLVAALQTRLETVEGRSGLRIEFNADGVGDLPVEIEEGLYRIAQEALNNALKHARAHTVSINLCQDQQSVILEIADDGVGFDPIATPGKGGLGLGGMKERALLLGGRLTVSSKPGEGTTVRVEVGTGRAKIRKHL